MLLISYPQTKSFLLNPLEKLFLHLAIISLLVLQLSSYHRNYDFLAVEDTISNNTTTLERVGSNLKNSFQEVAINNISSTASQSAINGDSFSESLKNQSKNILVYTIAKVAANEIGRAYHGSKLVDANGSVVGKTIPTIDKPTQLLLHASLGATTSYLTGNDAVSGAISGVVGEVVAESSHKAGADISTSIQIASLSSAISSISYGSLTNQNDQEIANNAFEGSRIGGNAAQNNALYIGGKVKLPFSDKITGKGNDYDLHSGLHVGLGLEEKSIGTDGKGSSFYLIPEFGVGGYINLIPHNDYVNKSFSLGYRNFGSVDYLKTKQGNDGYGVTIGISTSPITIIPGNITIDNTQSNNLK